MFLLLSIGLMALEYILLNKVRFELLLPDDKKVEMARLMVKKITAAAAQWVSLYFFLRPPGNANETKWNWIY